MTDIPESARQLLIALIEIEDRARVAARLGGCRCDAAHESSDRHLPIAVFNRESNIGIPLNQIEWEMIHEEGCPMEGQKGVG